ncbi:glycosyl transferase family 1 [Mesonia ostreae]|uniref:Glycosyl transferase family 1 n=1 Tax=Mesonia ostreae TaxID=861110 RepID=A0ABU2KK94_9FLAO|nr:glycosyl transferase family 1 [Mesonia ostreae]MDT0295074.1 glycosyl transferase family 1 [Mesonia ostreae]
MPKKVLIVLYYWPPAGGPGVQRWLKFVKYLPEFGIEPIVYAPQNPNYPIVDVSLLDEISSSIQVIKQPIFEPYAAAKVFSKAKTETISSGIIRKDKKQSFLEKTLLYIRGNFFIPDARKFWVQPSVKFLKDFIQKENIETLITTGPPHSLHLIGLQLKQALGVRWIADFRDPWTTIGYHQELKLTQKNKARHIALEKQVLREASTVIVTSFKTQQEFSAKTNRPVITITNGFDGEVVEEKVKLDKKFTISHIGSLLSKRNPEMLWKVLSDLCIDNPEFKKAFKLQLIGKVSEEVLEDLKTYGLDKNYNYLGYIKHSLIYDYQKSSQVLLLVEIDSELTQGIIPGKLFEYLKSNRPILAIGPENWDVEEILKKTQRDSFLLHEDYSGLKERILNYFHHYQSQQLKVEKTSIGAYHRKELTSQLASVIHKD